MTPQSFLEQSGNVALQMESSQLGQGNLIQSLGLTKPAQQTLCD